MVGEHATLPSAGDRALSTDDFIAFLDASTRPLDAHQVDAFWYHGELIDRQFSFVFAGGRLTTAMEMFGVTTGAPPLPLADPAAAWELIAQGRGDLLQAIDQGRIRAPFITAQMQFWLMPDVVAYEVNYLLNDYREMVADRPALMASMDRWRQIVRACRTDSVRYDGMDGQFQRARYLQTYFLAGFIDGQLQETREMGFGSIPDYAYPDPAAIWRDLADRTLSPLPDVPAGRFGEHCVVSYRVLKHGAMGHLGIFLRPGRRLGVA
ncbi:MAG: hypothetical protein NZ518_00850 [Dehalococcoidia bacterium]|nr:hypothetical protein [Dehalococcoidia bacterium]